MVIAAVGATSAAALPQFIEISAQAEATALTSLAVAASSAMVLNLAGCMVTGQMPVTGKCTAVNRCEQVLGLLMADLPPGYRVAAAPILLEGPDAGRVNGVSGSCAVVQDNSGASAGFVGLSAGLSAGLSSGRSSGL